MVLQDFDHDNSDADEDGTLPALDNHAARPPAKLPPVPQVFSNNSDDNVHDESLRHFFAFLLAEIVNRMLQQTTQYAHVPMSDIMKRFYKSPYPALNVAQRNKDLLTDVVYCNTQHIRQQ